MVYRHESSLFLLKKSGHLFGFEGEMADLLEILHNELLNGKSRETLLKEYGAQNPAFFRELLDLLQIESIPDRETYEPPLQTGPFRDDGKERISFVASPFVRFDIDAPTPYFREAFLEQFAHLKLRGESGYRKRVAVDIVARGELWQILFNKTEVGRAAAAESIPLILQENLIILSYQSAPYLMALHAGAVASEAGTAILPAVSGSGKTTLTAALVAKGFSLYSDEIALVGTDGKLTALPFSLNIKEGSWKVLEKLGAKLNGRQFVRFDGQRVRYLPPKNLADSRRECDLLLFPRYEKEAPAKARRLSPVETLRRITAAGYQLHGHLDAPAFEAILEHLLKKPAYSLTYGSLDEATRIVERLLRERSEKLQ